MKINKEVGVTFERSYKYCELLFWETPELQKEAKNKVISNTVQQMNE